MTNGTTVAAPAARPLAHLRSGDPLIGLTAASLIGLLVVNSYDGWLFAAAAIACLIALPRPRLITHPAWWAALFLAFGLRQLATWPIVDDHVIAMTYWCGALALGLRAADAAGTLAASARLLIGTLFAFAAGWKLLSGQFIDGTFFRYSLVFDDRFEVVARILGGTTSVARDHAAHEVSSLIGLAGGGAAVVDEGPRNAALAQVFTWWGIVIESAVAVSFLAPLPLRWGWLRHLTLLAFAGTTYLVVPIGAFGTFLLILGSALVTTHQARLRYYAGGVVLLLWSGLWPLVFL